MVCFQMSESSSGSLSVISKSMTILYISTWSFSSNLSTTLSYRLRTHISEASALAAASQTAIAVSDSDEEAFRDCVLARAAWVGSRSDATALAREALEEEKDKQREREEAEREDEAEEPPDHEPAKPRIDDSEKPTDDVTE